jgi:hypothetical protein
MINPNPVMAPAAIGLTPIFPTIEVVPVVVIPDFESMAKLPAVPRLTGASLDTIVVKLETVAHALVPLPFDALTLQ